MIKSKKVVSALLLGCFLGFLSSPAYAENLWTEGLDAPPSDEAVVGGTLFRRLAERLSPAVVNIRSLQKVDNRAYGDFPYSRTPGRNATPPANGFQERGEGSGFIIRKDGYILTNSHVVVGSDEVQVALSDGRLFRGKYVGMDEIVDIALIKIDAPDDLPVVPLGSSDQMKPGDWVMATGSPFGLELSVTVGIVSAKGRSLGSSIFDDFIQTDTPINPGNSGGPLINTRGEVVGINTAVISQGQGLGFSLPIDLVKKLLPQLKEKGRIIRSWLGVVVQDITLQVKEALRLPVDRGSLVTDVVAESPAFKAGIRRNDVIVEFDGQAIKNSHELPMRVAHTPAGTVMRMKIVRAGKTIETNVTLEAAPLRSTP